MELLRGTRLGDAARREIDRAETCLTPAIVLAEVALRRLRDGGTEPEVARELRAICEASQLVPVDRSIALAGARAREELRATARAQNLPAPGLGDGLVLATTRRFASRLLTGDRHFRTLPETLWLE